MGESGEDYWQRQFREADERAALLAEASVNELVELYLVSEDDLDFGGMCFEALQRRQKADVRRAGWGQLGTNQSARRRFGVTLLSISDRTEQDRRELLPAYLKLLQDTDNEIVQAALQAINSAQLRFVADSLTPRMRSTPYDRYNPAWEDSPLPCVIDLAQVAPLIGHPDSGVRNMISHSLEFCGELDATAILLGLTWDPDPEVRAHAALELGRKFVGGSIGPSVERLWQLVDEPLRYIRACAITALVDLGQEEAEGLVGAELRANVDANENHMCVWPLVQLVSRRPELITEHVRQALDARRKRR